MNAEDDDLFVELSSSELRWLDIVSVVSSLLSIAGSTQILAWIWKDYRSSSASLTSHHRFLASMSVFDIVGSFCRYTLLPWTGSDTPSPSCTWQGATMLVTMMAPFYNVSLACFYCCIIRFRMRPHDFAKRYEPILHILTIGISLGFLVLLVFIDGYNPTGSLPSCSVSVYPPGCDLPSSTMPCERGVLASKIFNYGYAPFFILVWILLVGFHVSIFLYVLQLERRNLQWSASTNEQQGAFRKTRLVATQSFLYVLAFMICYVWPITGAIIARIDAQGQRQGRYFGWLLALHICMPAQGAFNALIYLRGRSRQESASFGSSSLRGLTLTSATSFGTTRRYICDCCWRDKSLDAAPQTPRNDDLTETTTRGDQNPQQDEASTLPPDYHEEQMEVPL